MVSQEERPLDSPHALVRQAVCQMFAGLARLQPAMVCTRTTAADVSVPLAWHTDMLPAAALSRALATDPQVLGQPLIQRAFLQHGHACFFLTPQAYGAMMKHILANTLAPDLPDPGRDPVDHAIARCLMLARKPGKGCPPDRAVQAALWLAMGIPEAEGPRREALRRSGAQAFLSLFPGRTPAQRLSLADSLGEPAACMARLLAYQDPA